jgi:hypothetical protein
MKINKRKLSQKELKDLGVEIKVVYTEEDQNEMEAVEEEAADKPEGKEMYIVVMPQGEKLPTDDSVKLDGYSIDNPYHAEKEEDSEMKATPEKESKNVTAEVNKIIEANDVPQVPEQKVEDPSARILDIAKPVDNYLTGVMDYSITEEVITDKTFMTLDSRDDLGYQHHNVRQMGAIDNNYSFMVKKKGDRKAGTQLDIMLDIVDEALVRAKGTKKYYIAPKKKDYQLRYETQPTLLCDVGLVERLQDVQTSLLDSNKYIQGQSPEMRRRRAKELDELISTLVLKSSDDNKPKEYGNPIPTKDFHTLCDTKVYNLKMAIAEIDKECMVREDYYDPIFEELQSTDKQVEKPEPEYQLHRKEYYDVKVELYRPDLITTFL